jgi:hypothetical protein
MSKSVSCGDADGGQRLHLDAGAVGGAHGGGDGDVRIADLEVDVDSGQRQRVAQRIRSLVRLAARMPATRAVAKRVALG